MGLFKKKSISERINKKWTPKTCSLSQVETVLSEEDLIDIWVHYYDTYFQVGSASDDEGFVDKIYYINFNMDLSLFKLLNNKVFDDKFFSSKEIESLFNVELIEGKTLVDIWHNCEIVAVDEMSPDNYFKI